MAKKRKKAVEIDVVEPVIVEAVEQEVVEQIQEVSERDVIKEELNRLQQDLNGGYDIKNRTSLLRRQQELQIKLRNL